jgi:hypothetical protein
MNYAGAHKLPRAQNWLNRTRNKISSEKDLQRLRKRLFKFESRKQCAD